MNDEYNDEWPTCERTFATARIFADELDPAAVDTALGVRATEGFRKGEPIGRSGTRRKQGVWLLGTKGIVDSKDLRRHIDWLLDAIEPSAPALARLLEGGATADIFCYWESRSGHGGPSLSPGQMGRLARLGISVGLDVYFSDEDSPPATV